MDFDWRSVEARWRRAWEEQGIFRTAEPSDRPKMYVLDFFPYPSGEGLSVGHARNYVPTDVLSRYFRMRGYSVLHPMGWDAFGLPAENEALLRGRHPRLTTAEYAASYRRQLQLIGCSYDWSREISTSDPAYYTWTQWGFLLLLRRGLAYRAVGWQWWCPRCRTILANEQVVSGRCWRHGDTVVERRALEQWYVRTTAYADRLLQDLDSLDWPDHIKVMQRNWIGRSQGVDVQFLIVQGGPSAVGRSLTVFTTRVDTLFGVTFIALAPEHPLAQHIATTDRRDPVEASIGEALRSTEAERMAPDAAGGVFTGAFAVHPLTGERLPIYVAGCVLPQHGTGAVMGVPAHDGRDLRFAAVHGLPVRRVIHDPEGDGGLPYTEEGVLVDSGAFSGLPTDVARASIVETLEGAGAGAPSVRYRMRDWLISRQRYWGAPIPVVYCDACGMVPVPEDHLPVLLPQVDRYEPSGTGRSPLAAIPEFVHTTCPQCGGAAGRETDTLDGFADSNWYYLRFADPAYAGGPWNPDAVRYWLPVDWYIGGAEHAVMHLLYARFFTKVLYDEGLVPFSEPFVRLRNQGSMLSPLDGTRMSKSRGNVITPDEVVEAHGADALRTAVLFIGPFDQDATWDPTAVTGARRFVRRLVALCVRAGESSSSDTDVDTHAAEAIRARLHRLIQSAGELIEGVRFNVLVAALMTFVNDAERWERTWRGTAFWREVMLVLVRLAAPLVPFAAEEAWARLEGQGSVHQAPWPEYDATLVAGRASTIILQVDGRVRDRVQAPGTPSSAEARDLALRSEKVRRALMGREVVDVIVVPGKVVNVVTK